jgi:hypothetical protein
MPKQQRIRDPLHDLIEFNVERSQLENCFGASSRPVHFNGCGESSSSDFRTSSIRVPPTHGCFIVWASSIRLGG